MISHRLGLKQIGVIAALLSCAASAQNTGAGNQNPSQPEGWEGAGYVVHQSIEVGYRASDVTGSEQMYGSLVNLRTGPRFLNQDLSMQSKTHSGVLFDDLFLSSFGWGGDPNNSLRFRLEKNNWYDFRSVFRRDQSNFDYNLLANPLNPSTSSPSIPVTSSPHLFATGRRVSDFDLTLFPQSVFDVRLGYSHNNMAGPSYSSVHEGTDALLFQGWNTTLNSFRLGADIKIFEHTVISYDQFLDYYKGDTSWQLAPLTQALLPSPPAGVPASVELGIPFDTGNKSPCAIVGPATSLIDSTGTLTNTDCNGFFGYNRTNRIRTSTPTERISLRSADLSRLEFTASYAYSSADMNAPFSESFNGLSSRSDLRQETVTGPGAATRISNVADFTAKIHISSHLQFVDTFRFWSYRIPESFTSTTTDWTCNDPSNCTLVTPMSATTPTLNPVPVTSDLSFNQSWKRNEADLVWDAKHFGGRVGFRYGDRVFHRVNDFTTGDEDRIDVHEYTPVFGFWARPTMSLRFNFDWEHTNNDATIVRIGPRKENRYRIQGNYTPKPWAVLGAAVNLWDASNADALIKYQGHNRNYGFTANLTPRQRIGFDFAYNYNDYQQNDFVCFNDSNTALPVVANAGSCVTNGYNDTGNNTLLTNGFYTSKTHYGMGSIMLRPAARVSLQAGYSITSVGGQTPQFNSLQPFGSLQYNYHQPLALLSVDIGHNFTWIAGWNYYQYGEKSFVGPTDPRYFHANNATFSLRWGF